MKIATILGVARQLLLKQPRQFFHLGRQILEGSQIDASRRRRGGKAGDAEDEDEETAGCVGAAGAKELVMSPRFFARGLGKKAGSAQESCL